MLFVSGLSRFDKPALLCSSALKIRYNRAEKSRHAAMQAVATKETENRLAQALSVT
jgi:hypothetical protein